jgi:putative transposase
MKRTISLKLAVDATQKAALLETQLLFAEGCNAVAAFAQANRCWNSYALHHLSYYSVRQALPELGSQMVCNARRKVCGSYKSKARKLKKGQEVPLINFKKKSSVRYCARTYSMKGHSLSLFTVRGRIKCRYKFGLHQEQYLAQGKIKEAELIRKGKRWFFNLVLDIPNVPPVVAGGTMGVDLGENNLATTSNGTIHGGEELRHKRDKSLKRRDKLQSNGSRSAKRLLKRISGKEQRHVRETNHIVSKLIVQEAVANGVKTIVLEDLKNIRERIQGNKRIRTRLNRWAWYQLQQFIAYKAEAVGIEVIFVNPAYTSQTCSGCGCLGTRDKHRFRCSSCGSYQHSDCNAAINLCKLVGSAVPATAPVNVPMVAAEG